MKFHFTAFISLLLIISVQSQFFPKNFTWGVASASYQIEGAWNEGGREPSIWDTFSSFPGRVSKNQTGKVADDFYHRYPEDIALMAKYNIKHFRMSLSWSRILPKGTVDKVNPEGVKFYNDVFDALLKAGITPWVTLYHWDLPQALDDHSDKGGWLNPTIIQNFNDYADFCYKTFGDRVKNWLTFNEINVFSWLGYGTGGHAPGRCSAERGSWCKEVGGGGNSATEPYIVAHNVLLSHGYAVKTYREKYQKQQGGQIGMTMNSGFAYPFDSNNKDDIAAVDTYTAFNLGWFADPQVFGDYPEIMKSYITDNRLPKFTDEQKALLKGSCDFLGINHYSSVFVQHTGVPGNAWDNDNRLRAGPTDVNGNLIGPYAESKWLNVVPKGLRGLLNWANKRYNHMPIYIFENGVSCPGESSKPVDQALNDVFRINYLTGYISNMALAMLEDKVDVRGYFLWSIIDNFEWADGYDVRFGTVYIDYENGLKRYPKKSVIWYSELIRGLTKKESTLERFNKLVNEKTSTVEKLII